jgi:Ca-activated chloride channel family protein
VKDAVRVEELLNYFDYDYPAPADLSQPFNVTTEIGPSPWNTGTKLLHIGIKAYEVSAADIPAANLVFLVDVSGSMQSVDKLELLKKGLTLLSKQMRTQDRVSIVVYAGASGIVLEPTPGNETFKITHALEQLTAGGSTNGAAGIRLAYQVAESAFIKGGVNRILLATDGDFNVGTTSFEQLMDLIEEKRKTGIGLSTLGFGHGNYNDQLAEQLANRGNGSYAYIDTLNEANKVLVDQLSSTLLTIAKDVKIQIEFNPAVVSEYRLVGYENRMLKREDFNNDKIDAGEIGAGHSVTALYEITLQGSGAERVDALRYGNPVGTAGNKDELAYLKLRYKTPGEDTSRLIQSSIKTRDIIETVSSTSEQYRFAAAVAGFGQLLRGGDYLQDFSYDAVLAQSREARGSDENGYRGEFIQLVKLAQSLGSRGNAVSQIDSNERMP